MSFIIICEDCEQDIEWGFEELPAGINTKLLNHLAECSENPDNQEDEDDE